MARTKQTARKTVGGPAPKHDLSATTITTTTRPRKKKSNKYKDLGPAVETNNWCSGCENGGAVVPCALCSRHICGQCIEFPEDIEDKDIQFYCSKCWTTNNPKIPSWKGARGNSVESKKTARAPYQGFWKNGKPLGITKYGGLRSLRGQWPLIHTPRMAILSIRLDGELLLGDGANIVYNHLIPYYSQDRGQLHFWDISFNLWTRLKSFETKMQDVVDELIEYAPETILIFITTHSTPEGDLWTAPGSLSASPPEQVLPILVPEGLQDLIKKAAGSMLIFLACGSLHSGESKAQAGAFVRRAGIQYGFGFTTEDFLPAVATTFLQDTVRAFFIGGYGKKFSHILATHYELGIHTDIVVYFHDGNAFRYTWHHPKLHPYGQPLRVQCSNCFTLEMHDIADYSEDKVVLRCRCKHTLVYLNARGGRPLLRIEDGPWKKTDTSVAGAWYGQWAVMQSECPNDPPSFPYPTVRKTDSVPA